ncbi:hypothetical protein BGZ76_006928 [Entomortierella beljakovae]|nr:hypothetical protein BGZ76_006928 [Entomortierella beljakovae]
MATADQIQNHSSPPPFSENGDFKQEFDEETLDQKQELNESLSHQTSTTTDHVVKVDDDQLQKKPESEPEPGPVPVPVPVPEVKKVHWKKKAWDLWMKNWFLLGLVVVIILARYFPEWGRTGGPIRPEYSVKYGITSCIFLLSGLSLKTKDLFISAINYRAHIMVQVTSFIIIPLFVKAVTSLIGLSNFNSTLLAGMAVTSATPTTISSNVVMTANADGNESLALFNAAFGNLLGVFISPVIVLILLHNTPLTPSGENGLDYATILRDLGSTILGPIFVGQIYLYFFPKHIAWAKKMVHFPTLNSACLLILVWTVFCDAFYNHTFSSVNAGEIIAVGALQAFIFWVMTFFLGFLARGRPAKLRILKIMDENEARRVRSEAQLEEQLEGATVGQRDDEEIIGKDYSNITGGLSLPRTKAEKFAEPMTKQDTVAILFCGATKSVAMGIPMIKILYSTNSGSAGLLATPLLIYHVEQLFSGAFMVSWLKKWVKRGEETLESFDQKYQKKQQKHNKKHGQGEEGQQQQQQGQQLGQGVESTASSASTAAVAADSRVNEKQEV